MQSSVSSKLIIALETLAIVVLAIVVIIYAQVLWQQANQVPPVVVEPATENETTADFSVSEAERIRVLEELSVETPEAPLEERAAVLEQLEGAAEGEAVITETDRLEVLRALQGE